jgi:tRNA nucleotidyltransferase/poly(A) polymerase
LEAGALGGRLLITGGQIRDSLLFGGGSLSLRLKGDYDAVVFGLGLERVLAFALKYGPAKAVKRKGAFDRKEALIALKLGPIILEISPARSPNFPSGPDSLATPKEDALTRDFTVNSIYYDPLTNEIIDPLGGIEDLKAKKLNLCGPDSLTSDPLRILRAMTLISRRSLVAGRSLLAAVSKAYPNLQTVSADRFWPEWLKWSLARKPHLGLYFLKDSQAIQFWPELAALIGLPQNRTFHPEGDAFNHTALVVESISRLPLSRRRKSYLLLSALLHDVGKPKVLRFNEHDQPITKGHPISGVPVAKGFLSRQRTPYKVIAKVLKMVRWHMELSFKELKPYLLRRVARALAPECDLIDLWAICLADWEGRRPRPYLFPYSLEEFLAPVKGAITAPPPLLRGQDLMAVFNITPGPQLGWLKNKVNAAFDAGLVRDRAEALALVKTLLTAPNEGEPPVPIAY